MVISRKIHPWTSSAVATPKIVPPKKQPVFNAEKRLGDENPRIAFSFYVRGVCHKATSFMKMA